MNGCKWLMLFGNRARGAFDVKSDWDILILTITDHAGKGDFLRNV
jgi:predicted nucleotidyltransferase